MQASTQPQEATATGEAPAQAPAQAPAPAPAQAPVATPAAPVSITIAGADGTTQTLAIPRTEAEVQELIAQRDELSDQLSSVAARRSNLSEEIRNAPEGASRTGLEDRIRLLDQRILQLETDIAATGRQLSLAPAELTESAKTVPAQGDDFGEGMLLGGFLVLAFFSLLGLYRRFRRRRGGKRGAAVPAAVTESRFDRLEHGMEAIAIEVERISEGQRFVTRLLSESASPVGANRVVQPVENPSRG